MTNFFREGYLAGLHGDRCPTKYASKKVKRELERGWNKGFRLFMRKCRQR